MAKIAEDHRTVSVNTLHPNPWNVNEMEQEEFRALKQSIEEVGFVEAPVVRAKPKKRGHWEILGGEHRWKAAREVGLKKLPIVVLHKVSEKMARKIVLMLNTKGRAEHLALAKELAVIYQLFGEEDANVGLPYTPDQLREMVALAGTATPVYGTDEMPGKPDAAEFATMVFHVPKAAVDVIEAALAKCMEAGESESKGVALERICADYLAGT